MSDLSTVSTAKIPQLDRSSLRIFMASDHAGVALKWALHAELQLMGWGQIYDLGPQDEHLAVDYPDYAAMVAEELLLYLNASGQSQESEQKPSQTSDCNQPPAATLDAEAVAPVSCFGILICGTGIGMSIAANRFPWIRAALCRTIDDARLSRAHNNANVLIFGSRAITGTAEAKARLALDIATMFISTPYDGGRHDRRVGKITQMFI